MSLLRTDRFLPTAPYRHHGAIPTYTAAHPFAKPVSEDAETPAPQSGLPRPKPIPQRKPTPASLRPPTFQLQRLPGRFMHVTSQCGRTSPSATQPLSLLVQTRSIAKGDPLALHAFQCIHQGCRGSSNAGHGSVFGLGSRHLLGVSQVQPSIPVSKLSLETGHHPDRRAAFRTRHARLSSDTDTVQHRMTRPGRRRFACLGNA